MKSKRSDSIMNLAAALAVAQGQIETASKDGTAGSGSYSYKYATLDAVWSVCRMPLSSNGLSVVQIPITDDNGFFVETVLMHSSGEWISSTMSLPIVAKNMSELQAIGSAITYARRYMLAAMIGVTTGDDDDGQSSPPTQSQSEQTAAVQDKPGQSGDLVHWQVYNPTKGQFFKKADEVGLTPKAAAKILKESGFANGYDPAKAPEMWEALMKSRSLQVNEPMPQDKAIEGTQASMDQIEADAAIPVAGDQTSDQLANMIAEGDGQATT